MTGKCRPIPAGADLAGHKPTLAQVGALIGATSRWVAELRARGQMPQDGATLSEFVRAWGAYLTNAERKPGGDLDAERTRLAAAQADAQERKNREADGELIGMAEAEAVFFDVARTARTAWMNWPSRVAPMLAATLGIDADPLRAALDEHVHQQLAELGEPDFEEARHG